MKQQGFKRITNCKDFLNFGKDHPERLQKSTENGKNIAKLSWNSLSNS